MSDAVLNNRFLTRLLANGEEDIERVFMLKEDISSTACEPTMLILSISVTFSVICLTVTSLISKSIMPATFANTFLLILQGSALADLGCGSRFRVHLVAVNSVYNSERIIKLGQF